MSKRTPSRSSRAYRALLRLFPFDFQREYASDMEGVFYEEQRDSRSRWRLWWRTVAGILKTAPLEHLSVLCRDIRYAVRSLAKAPQFTLVSIAALAIGIGANVAVFSVANATLIKTLPVPHADRVIRIYEAKYSDVPYERYLRYRDRNHVLSQLAASNSAGLTLAIHGTREVVRGRVVTGNYFDTLGDSARLGRVIDPGDDRSGADAVLMLGNDFWHNRFSGDAGILGRTLVIEGSPFTVVGIAPSWFNGDIAVPWNGPQRSHVDGAEMIGRLRDGVTLEQARADLGTLASQLGREANERTSISIYPARDLHPELSALLAAFLVFLMAIAAVVLLIVCLNIASLQLARLVERRHEIGIRLAVGAGWLPLLRQFLTESVLVSVAGCLASIPLVLAIPRLLAYAGELGAEAVLLDLSIDWRVVAFALAVSVLAAFLFGFMPALYSTRIGMASTVRAGAATVAGGQSRLRAAFIVGQVAMSVFLLATAGLLVRSLTSVQTSDRGFDTSGVLVAGLNLQGAGYTKERSTAFYEKLLSRLQATPGFLSANIAGIVPLTLSNSEMSFQNDAEDVPVFLNAVSRGHFQTLGIPLIAGRDFEASDRAGAPEVGIVNERLARRFWSGKSAVGQELKGRTGVRIRVVGVARDSKYIGASEDPKLFLYRPIGQMDFPYANVLVKTKGDPLSAIPMVRNEVRDLDPEVALFGINPLDRATRVSLVPMQVAAGAAGFLGLVALILGAIGIYGVVSHVARQRTREIGVRIALGAVRSSVVHLMTRDAMRWTAAGLLLGLIPSIVLARLFAGWIYGVSPMDPLTFIGIGALLAATAYLASWFPARRVSRIDPLSALREE